MMIGLPAAAGTHRRSQLSSWKGAFFRQICTGELMDIAYSNYVDMLHGWNIVCNVRVVAGGAREGP